MYADVVMGLDHAAFEEALEITKEDKGFYLDTEMAAEDWQALVAEYQAIVQRETGAPFPPEPKDQLWGAIGAAFASWESDRATVYRRLTAIPGDGAPQSTSRPWCWPHGAHSAPRRPLFPPPPHRPSDRDGH